MATTNAQIDITSEDLLTDNLSLSANMYLNQHGTEGTGLDEMNYHRANIPTGTNFTLIQESAALNTSGANYVYLINKNTDPTDYVIVSIRTEVIGRLYAGDWMFIPYSDATTATTGVDDPSGNDSDIEIQAVTHECTIEYAMFHNGETLLTASDS
jgi:hypothetical protein|tara:strand:+ start:222 stop:686 length:465 start_codon:yes stop_codon:yes gene_type:complete